MIKELCEYIEDNTTLVIGTTLFVGTRPPSIDTACVTVTETDPGIRNPHPDLSDAGQTPFNIYIRGSVGDGYFTTKTTADSVFSLLHATTQVTLPEVTGPSYLVNINCSDPYYIGPDEKNRKQFAIHAIVTKQEI